MRDKGHLLHLIASILGFIAVLDVAMLGTFVVESFLQLALLLPRFSNEAIIASVLTVTSGILLCLGSISLYKQHALRGAILNFAAWAIAVFIYFWGVVVWKFPDLIQIGLASIVLLVPPLSSGIIGLLAFRMERSTP